MQNEDDDPLVKENFQNSFEMSHFFTLILPQTNCIVQVVKYLHASR